VLNPLSPGTAVCIDVGVVTSLAPDVADEDTEELVAAVEDGSPVLVTRSARSVSADATFTAGATAVPGYGMIEPESSAPSRVM
jgi:hypothetical protein